MAQLPDSDILPPTYFAILPLATKLSHSLLFHLLPLSWTSTDGLQYLSNIVHLPDDHFSSVSSSTVRLFKRAIVFEGPLSYKGFRGQSTKPPDW